MAKYFLIFFSCALCFSLAVFILDQMRPEYKKQVSLNQGQGKSSTSKNKPKGQSIADSKLDESKTTQPNANDEPTTSPTTSSENGDNDTDMQQAEDEMPTDDLKVEVDPARPTEKTEEDDSELGGRFQPDLADTQTEESFPKQKDSLELSSFYAKYIQPWVERIFSREKVDVKIQREQKADTEKQIKDETPVLEKSSNQITKDTKSESESKDTSETTVTEKPEDASTGTEKKSDDFEILAQAPQGWAIQVAAFQAKSDAFKIARTLKKSYHPHFIYETQIKGATWYRINIGPFENPGKAAAYKRSRSIGSKFKGAFVKKL